MSGQKQFSGRRSLDRNLRSAHRATVNEINKSIMMSLDTGRLQIGKYLLDAVFSGDPERVLSRNRRTAAGIKKASCKPRMPGGAARVKRIRRLKRP